MAETFKKTISDVDLSCTVHGMHLKYAIHPVVFSGTATKRTDGVYHSASIELDLKDIYSFYYEDDKDKKGIAYLEDIAKSIRLSYPKSTIQLEILTNEDMKYTIIGVETLVFRSDEVIISLPLKKRPIEKQTNCVVQ